MPAYNVPAGHSRRGSVRVSDAGGSRRSYRNGRVDSAVAESTSFPKGPPKSWGGRLAGTCCPARVGTAGLLPGSSVSCVISARAYPPLQSSGVTKPMATAFISFRGGTPSRLRCVYGSDLVLSRCSRGARSQGGGPPICWKVVRACSQPQGMFLHFETRRSVSVSV